MLVEVQSDESCRVISLFFAGTTAFFSPNHHLFAPCLPINFF